MRQPLCMDDADFRDWVSFNVSARRGRADSPCWDCTAEYHADMSAAGRCDGEPGVRGDRSTADRWEARRTRWREWKRTSRAKARATA